MTNAELLRELDVSTIEGALSTWNFEKIELLQALIKGRDLALSVGELDDSVLEGLELAIEFGNVSVVNVASLIAKPLVEKYDEAQLLIERLARSKRVQGRVGAILCLSAVLNDVFVEGVLTALISDKSKRVREMAIDWIGRNRKAQFLSLLNAALKIETDEKLKAYLSKEIALLGNGFYVRREGPTVYVTVAASVGIVGGFFNHPSRNTMSDREIAEMYLQELGSARVDGVPGE